MYISLTFFMKDITLLRNILTALSQSRLFSMEKQRIPKSQLRLSSLPAAECRHKDPWLLLASRTPIAIHSSVMFLDLRNLDWRKMEPCGSLSCRESISRDHSHSPSKRHEWLRCMLSRDSENERINVFNYMRLRGWELKVSQVHHL